MFNKVEIIIIFWFSSLKICINGYLKMAMATFLIVLNLLVYFIKLNPLFFYQFFRTTNEPKIQTCDEWVETKNVFRTTNKSFLFDSKIYPDADAFQPTSAEMVRFGLRNSDATNTLCAALKASGQLVNCVSNL